MKDHHCIEIIAGDARRATTGSAGYDLFATHNATIGGGCRELIRTGVRLKLPRNVFAMVCSRSGLALKHGLFVLNAPGIIDADYEGEVGVILANSGPIPLDISEGDAIAQLVFAQTASFGVHGAALGGLVRGDGGYGSTGR